LSPPGGDGALSAAPEAPPPLRPPLEAELVQHGRLSMGQLAQAHRERLEQGGSVLDIVVAHGWVTAEEVAEARAQRDAEEAAAAAYVPPPSRIPETATAPEPEPEPKVAEQPVAAAAPQPAGRFRVAVRLSNGELVTAGEADGADGAEALAQVVVADVATADGDCWPYMSGRYIRPETIVSVDILATD
jgi:hypothetical protein